jgi:hypothetical protein
MPSVAKFHCFTPAALLRSAAFPVPEPHYRFPKLGRIAMRTLNASIVCLILFLQPMHATAAPVPESKLAYVGEWVGADMRLKIGKDGKIAYKRIGVETKVDVILELSTFEGDNFTAGPWPFRSTFIVSRPPHSERSLTKMMVDGVVLTKVD